MGDALQEYLTETLIIVTKIFNFFYAYAEYCIDNHMT